MLHQPDVTDRNALFVVHLCGVQDLHDFAEDGVRVALVLLTHQLNVSEFAEVKISLFLQTVDRQFQIQQLQANRQI